MFLFELIVWTHLMKKMSSLKTVSICLFVYFTSGVLASDDPNVIQAEFRADLVNQTRRSSSSSSSSKKEMDDGVSSHITMIKSSARNRIIESFLPNYERTLAC